MESLFLLRINRLRNNFKKENIDGVVITRAKNRLYYSGFSGSNGCLLITCEKNYLFTDGRYTQQAKKEAKDFQTIINNPKMEKTALSGMFSFIKENSVGRLIAFEGDEVTVNSYRKYFNFDNIDFIPYDGAILSPRLTKEEEEIVQIKNAISIAEAGFREIQKFFVEGKTERQVAAALEYQMKLSGAKKPAFDTIVGSGENGALPHAGISDRKFSRGDSVVVDWGALNDKGYHSDMTRTVFIGEPDKKMKEVYKIVLLAQEKALEFIGPGRVCKEVDGVSRKVIMDAGFGEYFSHSLGHGVGLDIHEGPTLSQNNEGILKPGMVVTVEPGIYIPGKGGVRIEDMVLITDEGKEVLTSLPKIRFEG